MAARPPRPPFREKTTDNEFTLSQILNKKPALVGETYLPRETKALEYAKLLLAEDATPAQKKQLKAAWDWRDGQYAEWRRECKKFDDEARRAALEKPREKRQKTKPESVREAEEEAVNEEKCTAYVKQSRLEYDQDPARLASLLKDYITEETKNPAIRALALSGMCECAGSLGSAASWAVMVWLAAQKCRSELLVDRMDDDAKSAFLKGYFRSLPKLADDAAAAFEGVSEETWKALGAIKWPQTVELDEDVVTPLDKISGQLELFEALVANPDIGMEDVVQLMSTVMFLSHGSAIGTNLHCGVMDPRVLRIVRDAYLQDEAQGNIQDPEKFYALGRGERVSVLAAAGGETARKFTRKLEEGSVLSEARLARARFSIFGKGDAKTKSVSLLTAETVVPAVVVYGAVKELEKTDEQAKGVIVVAVVLDDHIYHVQCGPGDFAVTNPFTVDCALRLFGRFAPILALAPRQSVSSVLPLKMESPGDGGFLVGGSSNSAIVASVKCCVAKVIGQMDPILGASVAVAAAKKVPNVPAHLLTARLASATTSGELPAFITTADGLPTGFGFDVPAWRELIKSMPNIDDISKAVGPLGHILCSCPTPPPPPPAPAPAPQPTNVNGVNLGHNWTNQEHVDTGQGQG